MFPGLASLGPKAAGPPPEGGGRGETPFPMAPTLRSFSLHGSCTASPRPMPSRRCPSRLPLLVAHASAGSRPGGVRGSRPQGLEPSQSPLLTPWRFRRGVARCSLGLLFLSGVTLPSGWLAPKSALAVPAAVCPRAGRFGGAKTSRRGPSPRWGSPGPAGLPSALRGGRGAGRPGRLCSPGLRGGWGCRGAALWVFRPPRRLGSPGRRG